MVWFKNITILIFLLMVGGCLSGPLPEETQPTLPPVTTAPGMIQDLTFVPFESASFQIQDQEFKDIIPEIEGLQFLPYTIPVDVLSNDLGALDHPQRLQLLASVVKSDKIIYSTPKEKTDTIIYFTVYKMNDSNSASQVLEAYKSAWNKRLMNVSGREIWIWDGYVDEIEGRASPFSPDIILYWNPEDESVFDSRSILVNHPALTSPESTLYSVHGETTKGPNFIMIDIKTELQDIQNRTESLFTQALNEIFKEESAPILNPSDPGTESDSLTTDQEIEVLEEKIRLLLEEFLQGNVSKDEYDQLFEGYNLELAQLKTE
jgi:PBP1b-binding outer membrane lipoprotein LpoB